ncbi:hypothetical protein F4804DRAFT_240043 [Jackrogersella minutella]|nr:hypothetical protein F4804DRAFT_240043 [Jackrogersella minutella]
MAATCNNARMIDRSRFREVTAEAAWKKITEAAKTKDMEDVKEGVQEYVKSVPNTTYPSLEEAFRAQGVAVYLVALENPSLMSTHTHMDLQGNLGKKYRVHYRFTDKPLRPRENRMWPKSHEENLQRLLDAGETVDRGLPKCSNCGELGHISKRCSQEKTEKEHLAITCFNCEQPGHRVRDCKFSRNFEFHCLLTIIRPGATQEQIRLQELRVSSHSTELRHCPLLTTCLIVAKKDTLSQIVRNSQH